jgi:hypothetical protein
MLKHLEEKFTHLKKEGYRKKSEQTSLYNCIAFAVGDMENWWWPDQGFLCFWPRGVARKVTLKSFIEAFETMGYQVCDDSSLESSFEKVAIYVDDNNEPTHAARQTRKGKWISKIGDFEDIEHETLKALEDTDYGKVSQFMKRPIKPRKH